MIRNNKKGFTLVELLAVIVILAVILAIAVPGISGVLANAKKSAFEDNVKLIIKGIEYKILEAQASGDSSKMPKAGSNTTTELSNYGANPNDYASFTIDFVNDPAKSTTISLTGKTGGKFGTCAVTKATLSNISQTGTPGDGVISGC